MKRILCVALIFCASLSHGALPKTLPRALPKTLQGLTEPYSDSTVSATVTGRVSAILKREGQTVRKGEVILELEKEEQELQAELKERDWQAAKKVYEETQSVSREELWKKELEYKIAVAQLKERSIRAPFDGQVVKIFLSVGESCDVKQQILRVVDTRRCRFITYVESGRDFALGKGAAVELELYGAQKQKVSATVEYVSPVVDAASGLREIKVVIPNSDGKIKAGISGSLILSAGVQGKK